MSMVSQLGMSYEATKGSGYAVSQACCMGYVAIWPAAVCTFYL